MSVSIPTTEGPPAQSLTEHRTWAAWAFFGLGIVLVIGWPIAAIVNWSDIVHSHTRLGYLVGDIGLVTPACFATWYGLREGYLWAPGLLMLTIGAAAYDAIHFFIFLAQERFISIPPAGYIAILAAILAALTFFAVRELRAQAS